MRSAGRRGNPVHLLQEDPSTSATKEGWRLGRSTPTAGAAYKPEFNDLIDADTGEVVLEAGKKITARRRASFADKGLKALRLAPTN
jgi:DNA-directed RNA polymerase subunit beta